MEQYGWISQGEKVKWNINGWNSQGGIVKWNSDGGKVLMEELW